MTTPTATGRTYRLVWGEPYGDKDAATGTVTDNGDRYLTLRTADGTTHHIDRHAILTEQEIGS
jgi:hypothetical protein